MPLPSVFDFTDGAVWGVALGAGIEYYSSEIRDSPIARQDYETEIGLSAVYRF